MKRYRNKNKQAFAEAYRAWLIGQCRFTEPDRRDYGLSAMGAQSVWLDLRCECSDHLKQ